MHTTTSNARALKFFKTGYLKTGSFAKTFLFFVITYETEEPKRHNIFLTLEPTYTGTNLVIHSVVKTLISRNRCKYLLMLNYVNSYMLSCLYTAGYLRFNSKVTYFQPMFHFYTL